MNGDEVVGKADVRANEYYYFNVLKDKDGLTFLGWDADSDGRVNWGRACFCTFFESVEAQHEPNII